jgi:hypothetical protein
MCPLFQFGNDSKQSMAREVLGRSGSVRMRVLGESMLPSIWPGDVITVRQKPAGEFLIGEIGLFQESGHFFAHRIHKIVTMHDSIYFITRGDSVPGNDPPFHHADLLGKVVAIQRKDHRHVPACPLSLYARVAGCILCHCNSLRSLSLRFHACTALGRLRNSPRQLFDDGILLAGLHRTK